MLVLMACLVLSQSKQVVLDAVGDVMLGRNVGKRIAREGLESVSRGVRDELTRADLALGNLECAITSAPFVMSKRFLLRADPSKVGALKRFGFTALSLANNHSGDCGNVGVLETQSKLRSIGTVPVGPQLDPIILERNGLKIGVLGILDLPTHWESNSVLPIALKRLRSKVDVVVVMVHWGHEGSHSLEATQVSLATKLAGLGVDLVLGSHPHVLQPVHWVKGADGHRCLVAFSLGNFVFDAPAGDQRLSMILSVKLGTHGVEQFKVVPVRIDRGYPQLGSVDFLL